MKLTFIKILVILLFSIAGTCWGSNVRVFNDSSVEIKIPFYAEFEYNIEVTTKTKHIRISDRFKLWYKDCEHYRLEIINSTNDYNIYAIHSGDYLCAAVTGSNPKFEPKWGVYPAFWLDKDHFQNSMFNHTWRMQDPKLIGNERMHQITVEHWHGHLKRKDGSLGTIDLWQSTDKRFPHKIKVQTRTAYSTIHWEITKLQLDKPVPGYMLSPQIHPIAGIAAQITSPYRTFWMNVLWYIFLLLAYTGFISALIVPKADWKRIPYFLVSSIAVLSLLWFSPNMDMYMNHISGLPMLILMALLTGGMLLYFIRKYGIPGNVRLFAGTRWPVIVWIVIAAGVGLLLKNEHAKDFAVPLLRKIDWQIPFLPQTLITVILHVLPIVALEEVVFRGYLIGFLSQKWHSGLLINLTQAVAFTIMHIPKYYNGSTSVLPPIIALIWIFIFGILFGKLRLKYNNLGAPWLVHSAYNIGFFYAGYAGIYTTLNSLKML